MDPNEAHKELTRLAAEVMNGGTLDVPEQMEFGAHFQALDDWIKSGGFPPHAWTTRKTYVVGVSANPDNTTFAHVIRVAAELVSASGASGSDSENTEYDRAIVEMTCDLLSISTESADAVLPFLRALGRH